MKNLKQRLSLFLLIVLSLCLTACGGEQSVSQDQAASAEPSPIESLEPSQTEGPMKSEESKESEETISEKESPSPSAEAVASSEDEEQEPTPTKTDKESEDPKQDSSQEKTTPAPTASPSAKPTAEPAPASTDAPAATPAAPAATPAQTSEAANPPATSQPSAPESAPVQSPEHQHNWEWQYVVGANYLGNCMYDQVVMTICYGCGETREEHNTTKIHNQWFDDETVGFVSPTCTEPGFSGTVIFRTYCDCGELNSERREEGVEIPPVGHDSAEYTIKSYTGEVKQDENGNYLSHWVKYCHCGLLLDEGWDY